MCLLHTEMTLLFLGLKGEPHEWRAMLRGKGEVGLCTQHCRTEAQGHLQARALPSSCSQRERKSVSPVVSTKGHLT